MITKFKIFESLNFDFTEDEWADINNIKTDTRQRKGEFLEKEIEFFESLGFTSVSSTEMEERTQYYTITLNKSINYLPKSRYGLNKKTDPYNFSYYIRLYINGVQRWHKTTDQLLPTSSIKERENSIRKILKELYLLMWENGIDPDTIKYKENKREKSLLKHKDKDPYGEENWEDENDK